MNKIIIRANSKMVKQYIIRKIRANKSNINYQPVTTVRILNKVGS